MNNLTSFAGVYYTEYLWLNSKLNSLTGITQLSLNGSVFADIKGNKLRQALREGEKQSKKDMNMQAQRKRGRNKVDRMERKTGNV